MGTVWVRETCCFFSVKVSQLAGLVQMFLLETSKTVLSTALYTVAFRLTTVGMDLLNTSLLVTILFVNLLVHLFIIIILCNLWL